MLASKEQVLKSYIGREDQFRLEVVKPLFQQMGFEVFDRQGSDEFGKDLILRKSTDFGDEWTAVIVKSKDITNTSRAKEKAVVYDVKRQVSQCWDLNLAPTTECFPNKVLLVTCGTISTNAQHEIQNSHDKNRNLSFISREQLVPLLDAHYREVWESERPLKARYLQSLKKRIEALTDFKLEPGAIVGTIGVNCVRKIRSEDKLLRSSLLAPHEVVKAARFNWIQGSTGSGKTFSVWSSCQQQLDIIAKKSVREEQIQIPLVIYVSGLELDQTASIEVRQILLKSASQSSPSSNDTELSDWLDEGRLIVFLDQVELIKNKERLLKFAEEVLNLGSDSRLVLLSRYMEETGYNFDKPPTVWLMRDINLSQASKVIAAEVKLLGPNAKEKYGALINDGTLQKLPRTPLVLKILRDVLNEIDMRLPNNSTEFFEMFFQVVLGRWEKNREPGRAFDYMQVRSFLEQTAFMMTEAGIYEIAAEELMPIAKELLSASGEREISAAEYVNRIGRIGDICRVDSGRFSFAQRAFQEFLAGCEVNNQHWSEDFVSKRFFDPTWEDSLIFAAGARVRDDKMLLALSKLPAPELRHRFMKMKNLGLFSQALYQSTQSAKEVAVAEGALTAISLRDDQLLIERIKDFSPDLPDIFISYMTLKLYAMFYGRVSLVNAIEAVASISDPKMRQNFYYMAAAANVNAIGDSRLNDILNRIDRSVHSPESVAMGGYLQQMVFDDGTSSRLTALLNSPRIRRMAAKTKYVLNEIRTSRLGRWRP